MGFVAELKRKAAARDAEAMVEVVQAARDALRDDYGTVNLASVLGDSQRPQDDVEAQHRKERQC